MHALAKNLSIQLISFGSYSCNKFTNCYLSSVLKMRGYFHGAWGQKSLTTFTYIKNETNLIMMTWRKTKLYTKQTQQQEAVVFSPLTHIYLHIQCDTKLLEYALMGDRAIVMFQNCIGVHDHKRHLNDLKAMCFWLLFNKCWMDF